MISLTQWAIRHGVSHVALAELQGLLRGEGDELPVTSGDSLSESYIQSAVRLEANESKEMNKRIKSADTVGIKQVLITQEMVGSIIGQFAGYEIKESEWSYSGSDHEKAQQRWGSKVISMGGDFKFVNKVGML